MKLDDYHAHEAMDRAHLVCCLLDEHLLQHQYFEVHTDLRDKLQNAFGEIYAVYQEISARRDQ